MRAIATAPAPRPLKLLADPPFLRLWLIGACMGVARWVEMLAVGVYVYEVTASPFAVAFFTFLRMAPLALFGAVAGAAVDRVGPKRLLIASLAVTMAIMAALAAAATAGVLALWQVGIGTFCVGVLWSIDYPARRTLMVAIAGRAGVGTAMGLEAATNAGTRALGPAAGGLVLAFLGLDSVYLAGGTLYLLSLLMLAGVPTANVPAATQSLWRNIAEALAIVRGNRRLVGALLVTVIFNVFGFPYVSMIPVIGRDLLALDPLRIGMLASVEGCGGLAAALVIAFLSREGQFGRIYVYGLMTCLAAVVAFALAPFPLAAGAAVAIAGFGAGCFSAMQSAIVLLAVAPVMRSRVMGLLVMCIGTAPLGFLHLGLMADWLGAPAAVVVMAAEGIAALLAVRLLYPEVIRG